MWTISSWNTKVWYLTYLTYALSLPVEHRPQTTRLHPALSCAAFSIFLQLYLKPAVHISFSSSRFHVFFDLTYSYLLPLWPCAVHCSACLAMLSPLFLRVWPSQFHFLLLSWTNTVSWSVFFHSSLLDILSGQWMSNILLIGKIWY